MPEWKAEISQQLASLTLEPTRETAIIEELSQHLDDCYAELLANGASEVALMACWIPARRATKVDPIVALRCE